MRKSYNTKQEATLNLEQGFYSLLRRAGDLVIGGLSAQLIKRHRLTALNLMTALLMFFSTSIALAQSGTVIGRVTDASSGEPLPGANIIVEDNELGTATDPNGEYELRLPTGDHTLVATFMGYEESTASVTVTPGGMVTHNFDMESTTLSGGEILVTGLRRGQVLEVNEKKESVNIMDVVSADEMGKLPDLNVAESTQRISGVTIRTDQGEGRFVSIRGTPPELNSVQFNGQTLASAAGSRATALDLVPSEMVSKVQVAKAITPDMNANALGGLVNISTLTAFDRQESFLTGSFNGMVHQITTDFGDRRFPFRGSLTGGTKFGANNEWGIVLSGTASRRDFRTSIYRPSDWIDVGGTITPEEYEMEVEDNNRWRYAGNLNLDFRPSPRTSLYSRLHYSHRDEQFLNTEVQFAAEEINPTGEYTGQMTNFEAQLDIPTTEIDEKLYALTLGGEQDLGAAFTLNAAGTYTRGTRTRFTHQPEWGEEQAFSMSYDLSGEHPVLNLDDPSAVMNPENYVYTEMDIEFEDYLENTYQFQTDLRMDFQAGDFPGYLKTGAQLLYRDKDIDENENPWAAGDIPLTMAQFAQGTASLMQRDDAMVPIIGNTSAFLDFFEQNRGQGYFDLDPVESAEEEVENDAVVTEGIYAGYLMGSIRFGALSATGGVRAEATETTAERYQFVQDPSLDNAAISQDELSNSYIDYLPSLHMVYRFSNTLQVRGAWSNTIGRPDYEELSAFQDVEFEESESNPGEWFAAIEEGNPKLKPFRSMNIDLAAEFYWGTGGLLSVGAFHKQIQNPIFEFGFTQRDVYGRDLDVDIESVSGFEDRFFEEVNFSQRRNADEGSITGLEISFMKILDFLPGWMSGLGIRSNLAIMQSEVTVPDREDDEIPFFDQSDLVYNLVPYYQAGGLELRFAMNYQSAYLDEVGGETFEDIYGDDRFTIDLTARYKMMNNRLHFNAYVRNLTNEAERNYQGISRRTSYHALTGRTFELGVTYSL